MADVRLIHSAATNIEELQREWVVHLPVGGHVPNRLRLLMWVEGLEGKELAERSGLSEQYVSAVGLGRVRNISLANAQKLAAAVGRSVEEVFPETDLER